MSRDNPRDDDPLGMAGRPDPGNEPDDDLVVVPQQKPTGPNAEDRPRKEQPESFDVSGLYDQPPPPPPPSSPPQRSGSEFTEYFRLPDKRFSRPGFFRVVGRVAGCLGLVLLVLSVLGLAWGRTWFTGALILILMFLVGESAAVILDAVARLESPPPTRPKKDE
jgi:hypothetical protein